MDYRLLLKSYLNASETALYECRGCGYLTISGVRPLRCPKCEGADLQTADNSTRGPCGAEVEKC